MGDETARFKPYAMSLAFTSMIFFSNRIVSSGFKNFSEISFKFKHLAFVLFLFLVIYYLLKKKELWNVNKTIKRALLFVSLLFSVLNVLGTQMAYTNRIFFGVSGEMATLVFCAVGYFCSFYGVASVLLYSFKSNLLFVNPPKDYENRYIINHHWFVYFTIIFIFWLIWIIAYYPATVDYDAEWQICSYLGYWPATNHHPWFSSCVIGAIFDFGRNVIDDNFGMFLYIIFRAVCMALIYARCVLLLKKAEVRNPVVIIILLFYAVTPVWGAYAKQPFKDTFAAALFCWYIMQTVVLVKTIVQNNKPDTVTCLLYSLSGILAALFRHNYFHVMLLTSIVILCSLCKRKIHWKYMVYIFSGIFIYTVFNYYIVTYGGVQATKESEAFSLPFQQTARTVKYHGTEMRAEEKESINRVLDFNSIGKVYDPAISDPVKDVVKATATKKDTIAYFNTWFSQLLQYPVSYIEATIAGTYGYYVFTKDGYPSGGKGNCGMVILNSINKDARAGFDKFFNFNYRDRFKSLRTKLENFAAKWHQTPLVNLTDSIPLYTWLLVIIITYMLVYKKGILVIPAFAILLAVLTCVASPVNGSFRYFAGIAAAMPVLLLTIKNETEVD